MRPGNNKGHLNQNKVSNTSIHVQGSTLHMQQLMLKYMAHSSSHSVPGICITTEYSHSAHRNA